MTPGSQRPLSGSQAQPAKHASDPRRALGHLGESVAVAHLERQGFAILDRNARTRHGEIDIVAFDGQTLAIVEVKTRRGIPMAPSALIALEGLRPAQRARLRRLAAAWLQDRCPRPRAEEVRFDAIGIVMDERNRLLCLDHIEGAW